MPHFLKCLSLTALFAGWTLADAFASQGPGVNDGTASAELQRGIVLAFLAFFAVIFLANIGRRK